MIIKKNYGKSHYIVLDVTDIEYDSYYGSATIFGEIIDQKGCDVFLGCDICCVAMDEDVEIVKA